MPRGTLSDLQTALDRKKVKEARAAKLRAIIDLLSEVDLALVNMIEEKGSYELSLARLTVDRLLDMLKKAKV